MSDTIWTEDRIQQLRDMKAVGLSAAKIAVCLGQDFSRNSVIGKAHRLGIGGKEKMVLEQPREKHRPVRAPHVNKITLPPISKPDPKYRWGFTPRREPVVSIPAPVTEHVTLEHRTGCCWPTNDGKPFLYCNAPTKLNGDQSGYCPHHEQRMYSQGRAA